MAQTGYTPLQIYSSSTGGAAPAAGNLTNSTLGSELAINITDGKLFYKDNLGAVQVIAWKVTPTSAGGTGLTSYTAGDMLYYASGTALSKLAIGSSGAYMSSSGTAPQWTAPAALTKTDDTNVTLTLGGSASTALLNAASLTLGWTGTLAVSRGGTGTGTAFTAGSVVFAGASGVYSQDNANLFWDDSNNRLGIKTATPAYALDVVDNTTGVQSRISSSSSNGTSFAMVNTATNGRAWRIGGNYVIGNGEWSLYDDTAGKEVLRADSSQNVRVVQGNLIVGTAGKGIDFSANSHAAGMTSELLNWYEEGTWTPVLYSGATDATMSNNTSGRYTRIGRVVHIHLYIETSNLNGIGGGTLAIKGLPFTVNSGYVGYAAATAGYAGNLAITAGQSVALRPNAADTTLGVLIWNATTGTTDMTGTQWTNTGYVGVSLSYIV